MRGWTPRDSLIGRFPEDESRGEVEAAVRVVATDGASRGDVPAVAGAGGERGAAPAVPVRGSAGFVKLCPRSDRIVGQDAVAVAAVKIRSLTFGSLDVKAHFLRGQQRDFLPCAVGLALRVVRVAVAADEFGIERQQMPLDARVDAVEITGV